MKGVKKGTVILDRIIGVPFFFAGVLILFMMVAVSAEVLVRYFWGHPVSEIFEIVEYSLVFLAFLGAAWVLKKEGHARMDLLLSQLNKRNQALLNIVTSIICALMWGLITWFSIKVTWDSFKIGYYLNTMLGPPLFPILAVIPVGSFLLFVQFLRRIWGCVKILNESKMSNSRS